MRKYRFGDPFYYKKNLYWNGFLFLFAWHMGAYTFYKYKVSKLTTDEKETFNKLSTGQRYLYFMGRADETVKVVRIRGLSVVERKETTYGDLYAAKEDTSKPETSSESQE